MSISFVQVQNELKLFSFAFKELYSLINKTHLALMSVDGGFYDGGVVSLHRSIRFFFFFFSRYYFGSPCPSGSSSPLLTV